MIKIAINGYGRIGRVVHRVILKKHAKEVRIVAINAGFSTNLKGWMYLLKFDSIYKTLNHNVTCEEVLPDPTKDPKTSENLIGYIVIDEDRIPVFSQKDPTFLPWKKFEVDVVIDCTGKLLTKEKAKSHIDSGARAVVMSSPAKDDTPTYVISVNTKDYKGENIINNASCTTNCIAPVSKVINDVFGVQKAMLTTIHAYTSDQELLDGGHKDYRRARAAAINIIPSSTGAAKATGKVLPDFNGVFTGLAIRVPVPVGSLSDITFLLKKDVTKEEVNKALTEASQTEKYKGILGVSNDPLVSSDIIESSYSSIVDLSLTQVVGGNMLKIISWYDNEWGYSNRLIEEVIMVGSK